MDQMVSKIPSNSSMKRKHLGSVLKNKLDVADRISVEKEHSMGGHHIHKDDSSIGK